MTNDNANWREKLTPLAVEIADSLVPSGESANKAAAYWVDARIRPLVEALQAVLNFKDDARLTEAVAEQARAALRAAGELRRIVGKMPE